jgi:ketosteroid isomerase-like protein
MGAGASERVAAGAAAVSAEPDDSSQCTLESNCEHAHQQAVRELLRISALWDTAAAAEDLDTIMAMYADDAVEMPPGVPTIVGKPAIRADYEFLFANYDLQHVTKVVQLEIQGTLSVERGDYSMLVVPADGSGAFVETGKHLIVRRWINGSWLNVMETWNVH